MRLEPSIGLPGPGWHNVWEQGLLGADFPTEYLPSSSFLALHSTSLSCSCVSGTGLGAGNTEGTRHLYAAFYPGLPYLQPTLGSSEAEGLKCLFLKQP